VKFTREQYVEILAFGSPERPMFCELFGPLVGLADEWLAQGATPDEVDLTAFDWDFVPYTDCGGYTGALDTHPPETLEETDEYLIQRDSLGRTTKMYKAAATIAHPLDYPVKHMDDWLKLKSRFEFADERIDAHAVGRARQLQQQGAVVRAGMPGGFDVVRQLLGEEHACLAYYEQPELVHDILQTVGDTCVKVYERISENLHIDQLSVHEDMAGKSGPLAGPAQIAQFIGPYYRCVWDLLADRGTKLFNQDSDGNMNPVIDAFLAAGVNVMHPFEPAAGMDMVATRKKYGPRLAIVGGIDKHVLRQDRADIRKELEYKIQPLMREGGTIFGLDHRIPNGTPLANYRYYVDTGRDILGLPPRDPKARGWGRMAF